LLSHLRCAPAFAGSNRRHSHAQTNLNNPSIPSSSESLLRPRSDSCFIGLNFQFPAVTTTASNPTTAPQVRSNLHQKTRRNSRSNVFVDDRTAV
jgi:hypothetical protein